MDNDSPRDEESREGDDELAAVVVLNEMSELYHVLERRLRGAAKGWPDHRREELDGVLAERFGDFFRELPDDAVLRLTEVALDSDQLHQAS